MMGIVQRTRKIIGELIGNTRHHINVWTNRIWSFRPAFDWHRVDYEFYDKLRRGRAEGLEKSGLLMKPVVNKMVAWMMGQVPEITSDDATLQADINEWFGDVYRDVVFAMTEAGHLGDAFIVFNGDGSLSVLPPNIVFPIVADADVVAAIPEITEVDYSDIVGWRVIATHVHPESAQTMRIEDEYYAHRRIRRRFVDGAPMDEEVYPNPLGVIPVVHIAANCGVNDLFGRPFAEALLPLLHDYGQILDAGLDGNYKQGRPVFLLEFDDTQSLDSFWTRYGEREVINHSDGSTTTNESLNLDLEGIVTTANANGEFKSPGSASTDTMNYLQLLYYIFVEHTEMPEFLLGSAIQGSKASAETQLPPFIKFIELMRLLNEDWIMQVIDLGVRYLRFVSLECGLPDVQINWSQLTDADNKMTLETLKWAYASGLIDDENAIRLMPVEIDNPEEMLAKIKADAVDAGAAFDDAMAREAEASESEPEKRNGAAVAAEIYPPTHHFFAN